ncbi:hypothetical protein HYX14_01370 [Candidatus Woesearchaeota archaeon]|nr:hypothetical protein [Candidatus Woesearchaeota archaeon]
MDTIKGTLLAVLVLLVALSALILPAALAAIEVTSTDLTINANYKDLRDNTKTLSIDHKITITNKGDAAENLTLSVVEVTGLSDTPTISPGTVSLAANASAQITITLKVPANFDQGTKDIGKLKILSSAGESLFPLKLSIAPMLEVEKVRVLANGHEEKTIDESGERVRDLNADDVIELRFQMNNEFHEDYDYGDIDGTITVEMDDSDFGDDVDEEEDFTIKAGEELDSESEEIPVRFTIPENAEDGDYTLKITVEGKDDNNAKYTITWDLELNVERNENDVRIKSFTLSPGEISCYRRVKAEVNVANYGSERQKHAGLSFVNPDLGVNAHFDLDLAKGTSEQNNKVQELWFDVKNDVAAGSYVLTSTAFYDFTTKADEKTVNLVIKDCGTKKLEDTTVKADANESTDENLGNQSTEQMAIDLTAAAKTAEPSPTATATATEKISPITPLVQSLENPYTASDFIIGLIIVAFVVIIALMVLSVVMLLRR